jgi:O-succinylbenzoate synthase
MPEGEIHIHRYTLRSRALLNARSGRTEHEGVLLRVDHGGFPGYGCIHPWPELGDADLEQTLSTLAEGEHAALSERALQCAKADANARRDGVSLFDGLAVPRSHATLTLNGDDFQRAVDAGFEIVKVKLGRDPDSEVRFIREQAGRFPGLRWRLDFNGVLETADVERFVAALGEEVRAHIDFLEDAYRLGSTPWVGDSGPFGITMAVDREVTDVYGDFGVAVIKPATLIARPVLRRAHKEGKRIVFTSYMDHALGQCFAAWEAARAYRAYPGLVDSCGLVTHGLFEPDAFTEALGPPGPDFHPPAGTGLGFDDLLESLPWEPLT